MGKYTTYLMQLQLLELVLVLEKKILRYDAGTIVDGENVGGQFKPKDNSVGVNAVLPTGLLTKITDSSPLKDIDFQNLWKSRSLILNDLEESALQKINAIQASVVEFLSDASDTFNKLLSDISKRFKKNTVKPSEKLLKSQVQIEPELQSVGIDFNQAVTALQRLEENYNIPKDELKKQIKETETQRNSAYEKYSQTVDSESLSQVAFLEAKQSFLESQLKANLLENQLQRFSRRIEQLARLQQEAKSYPGELNDSRDALMGNIDDKTRGKILARQKALLEIEWRKNVVASEIKFGQKVDGIVSTSSLEEATKKYNSFIESLKKKEKVTLESYQKELALPVRTSSNRFRNEMLEKSYDVANKELGNLDQVVDVPLDNIYLGYYDTGSSANISTNTKLGSSLLDEKLKGFISTSGLGNGTINIGKPSLEKRSLRDRGLALDTETTREIVWHEAGHMIEFLSDKSDESAAFREERANEKETAYTAGDTKMHQTTKIKGFFSVKDYPEGQFELDSFYNDYMSIVRRPDMYEAKSDLTKYTQHGDVGTEIISIGLESLSHPRAMAQHVAVDRESFMYAMSALDAPVAYWAGTSPEAVKERQQRATQAIDRLNIQSQSTSN